MVDEVIDYNQSQQILLYITDHCVSGHHITTRTGKQKLINTTFQQFSDENNGNHSMYICIT